MRMHGVLVVIRAISIIYMGLVLISLVVVGLNATSTTHENLAVGIGSFLIASLVFVVQFPISYFVKSFRKLKGSSIYFDITQFIVHIFLGCGLYLAFLSINAQI
jgi:hypothetical protein